MDSCAEIANGVACRQLQGLFASGVKVENLARMRELLGVAGLLVGDAEGSDDAASSLDHLDHLAQLCPCCGGTMRIIEVFEAGCAPCTVVPEEIDSS